MKYLFLSIALFFASFAAPNYASADHQSLLDSTSRYVEFVNQFGSEEGGAEGSESIFAPTFRKSVNGELSDETPESFLEQMEFAKIWVGGWYAQVLNVTVSPETQSATIYYICTTKEEKAYITFAMLHFNEDNQITELTTVYNLYAGQEDLVHIN